MSEIKTALVLTGFISIGTIIISFRYIKAKVKIENTRWKKDLDRPDFIQMEGLNDR